MSEEIKARGSIKMIELRALREMQGGTACCHYLLEKRGKYLLEGINRKTGVANQKARVTKI